MRRNQYYQECFVLFVVLALFLSMIDGKGFGGGRGGGGFRGGSKGGGIFGGSKGGGIFGGSKGGGIFGGSKGSGSYSGASGSSYRGGYGNNMGKPRTGSSFQRNAMSFVAGAAGGIAAYSIMRSMAGSYHRSSIYYPPGYGTGEKCYNNQDMDGFRYGFFRCPIQNFTLEDRFCCGEYGRQFCCPVEQINRPSYGGFRFFWIVLIIIIGLIICLLWKKTRSQRKVIRVPAEAPIEGHPVGTRAYQPVPPVIGYPIPPGNNSHAVQSGNPLPNPTVQSVPTQNPYAVTEESPPPYDQAVREKTNVPPTTAV